MLSDAGVTAILPQPVADDDELDVLLADGPPQPAEPAEVGLADVPLQVVVRPGEVDGHAVQVRAVATDRKQFLAALFAIERQVEQELAAARESFLGTGGRAAADARERLAGAAAAAEEAGRRLASAKGQWESAVRDGDDVRAAALEGEIDQLARADGRARGRATLLAEVAATAEAEARDGLREAIELAAQKSYTLSLATEKEAADALTAAVIPPFRTWLLCHTRRAALGRLAVEGRAAKKFARLPD